MSAFPPLFVNINELEIRLPVRCNVSLKVHFFALLGILDEIVICGDREAMTYVIVNWLCVGMAVY